MTVRAIRGAVQVEADDRDAILEATAELVTAVMSRNDLTPDDVISVLFTVTPDLTAEFPALDFPPGLRSRFNGSNSTTTAPRSGAWSIRSMSPNTRPLAPPRPPCARRCRARSSISGSSQATR